MTIREMIRLSIEDSERWRGGLGNGEAERSASEVTPDRANRPVEKAGSPRGKDCSRITEPLCRVVGFIPPSREGSLPNQKAGMIVSRTARKGQTKKNTAQ